MIQLDVFGRRMDAVYEAVKNSSRAGRCRLGADSVGPRHIKWIGEARAPRNDASGPRSRKIHSFYDGRGRLFEVGSEGKRRPSDLVIPDFVAPDEIEQCLFDLLHESAHSRHPSIARLPDEA